MRQSAVSTYILYEVIFRRYSTAAEKFIRSPTDEISCPLPMMEYSKNLMKMRRRSTSLPIRSVTVHSIARTNVLVATFSSKEQMITIPVLTCLFSTLATIRILITCHSPSQFLAQIGHQRTSQAEFKHQTADKNITSYFLCASALLPLFQAMAQTNSTDIWMQ